MLNRLIALIKYQFKPKDDIIAHFVNKLCASARSGVAAEQIKGMVLMLDEIIKLKDIQND